MRGKAKYLAIIAVLCVVVLAAVLVGCAAKPLDVLANTTDWLAKAENAKVEDTIEINNVKIDIDGLKEDGGKGFLTVEKLKIKSTREIKGDAMKLTLEVQEIKGVSLKTTGIFSTIGALLEPAGIKLAGLDNVTMKIIANYDLASDDSALTLEFHGSNLDKFMSSLPAGTDSNPNNELAVQLGKNEISGDGHSREEALIGGVMDLLDNPIYGPATSADASKEEFVKLKPNFSNFKSLIDVALEQYGEDLIADSGETANSLIKLILGSDSISTMLDNVLKFPVFALKDVKTNKVDGKEVLSNSTINTKNTKVELGENYMQSIKGALPKLLAAFGVDENTTKIINSVAGVILTGGKVAVNIGGITINSVYTNVK